LGGVLGLVCSPCSLPLLRSALTLGASEGGVLQWLPDAGVNLAVGR
jgi:cytochrome c biogenesis protein CcdA